MPVTSHTTVGAFIILTFSFLYTDTKAELPESFCAYAFFALAPMPITASVKAQTSNAHIKFLVFFIHSSLWEYLF